MNAKPAWPLQELSEFVEAGGMRWHVQRCGAGPALLLIHGTGASTHSWRRLMPLLAADYSVVAVDLPGHGLTAPLAHAPTPDVSIRGMSEGLGLLLRALEIAPRHVVGHSAGAVVLCRMALDERVAPRVIVSVNGAFVPLAGAAAALFSPIARWMASVSLVPRLLSRTASTPASMQRMLEGTGSHLDAESIALYANLVSQPAHVAGALEMMGRWNLAEFEHDLPKLTTPLVLLVGGNDRTVPPRQALWIKQRVPGAEIVPLPGLGHLAHEEAPATVAQTLLAVFRAHGG